MTEFAATRGSRIYCGAWDWNAKSCLSFVLLVGDTEVRRSTTSRPVSDIEVFAKVVGR